MLNELISTKCEVAPIITQNGWLEFDTETDYDDGPEFQATVAHEDESAAPRHWAQKRPQGILSKTPVQERTMAQGPPRNMLVREPVRTAERRSGPPSLNDNRMGTLDEPTFLRKTTETQKAETDLDFDPSRPGDWF